jgi:hypothetical protein
MRTWNRARACTDPRLHGSVQGWHACKAGCKAGISCAQSQSNVHMHRCLGGSRQTDMPWLDSRQTPGGSRHGSNGCAWAMLSSQQRLHSSNGRPRSALCCCRAAQALLSVARGQLQWSCAWAMLSVVSGHCAPRVSWVSPVSPAATPERDSWLPRHQGHKDQGCGLSCVRQQRHDDQRRARRGARHLRPGETPGTLAPSCW